MTEKIVEKQFEPELQLTRELARSAGREALKYYGTRLHVELKEGLDEPVTQADYAANNIIVPALQQAFPEDGMLSEESEDTGNRLSRTRVWMIDPLDGTSGFIDGNGDFAVQIGLIEANRSVLGVVYQPVTDTLYWAARERGAWVERSNSGPHRLHASDQAELTEMRLAASRTHRSKRMDQVVQEFKFKSEVRRGSVGIKIGLIVEKECDVYIHLSPRSKQWDTCAPEAILQEAGGHMTDLFGQPISYNSEDVRNLNGIVATNGVSHRKIIERLAPLLHEFGRAPV